MKLAPKLLKYQFFFLKHKNKLIRNYIDIFFKKTRTTKNEKNNKTLTKIKMKTKNI